MSSLKDEDSGLAHKKDFGAALERKAEQAEQLSEQKRGQRRRQPLAGESGMELR